MIRIRSNRSILKLESKDTIIKIANIDYKKIEPTEGDPKSETDFTPKYKKQKIVQLLDDNEIEISNEDEHQTDASKTI